MKIVRPGADDRVGIGQGLGLSTLTNAGMAGVAPRDAGAAGGLVNVAHHIGGAFSLGILVSVFAAAGSGTHGARELLAQRVSAALTGATALLVLAFLLVLIIRPSEAAQPGNVHQVDEPAGGGEFAALANTAHPPAEMLSEESAAAKPRQSRRTPCK